PSHSPRSFVHYYHKHPHLHSFPTRRSSDLSKRKPAGCAHGAHGRRGKLPPKRTYRKTPSLGKLAQTFLAGRINQVRQRLARSLRPARALVHPYAALLLKRGLRRSAAYGCTKARAGRSEEHTSE